MFVLGVIAALAAPLVMTLGFYIWEGLWKGSAFLLNTFKCSLATLVFILIVGCVNISASVPFFSHAASSSDVGMLILSSVLGIVVGDTCWLKAMKMLGARRVIVVDVIKPFLAAIVGFVGLGEPVTWSLVLGLCLTMAGVLVVNLEKEKMRRRPPAAAAALDGRSQTIESRNGDELPRNPGDTVIMSSMMDNSSRDGIDVVAAISVKVLAVPPSTAGGETESTKDMDNPTPLKTTILTTTSQLLLGYAIAFANVLFDVIGSFLTRRYAVGCTTFDINAIRFGAASAMLGTFAAVTVGCGLRRGTMVGDTVYGEPGWVEAMTRNQWFMVSLGVMFVTVGCPALSNWALFQLPLSICLCLTSVGPLYAIPMSYFFRKEQITPRAVFGSLLACGGVVVLYLFGER